MHGFMIEGANNQKVKKFFQIMPTEMYNDQNKAHLFFILDSLSLMLQPYKL